VIVLHLAGRVPDGGRPALEAFLAEARPFYESPGGIRVRLRWDRDDPARFLEIMEYADESAYLADQERVESDPTMRAWLTRWHALLAGPVDVSVWDDVPVG
jgi:quinol monooxygenase YgiN